MIPNVPEYLSVQLREEESLLTLNWLRSVSSEEYRHGLCFIKDLIIHKKISLWLVDSRKLTHVTFEDQQWLNRTLIPLLLSSRLRRIARVVQSDVFIYISFEQQITKAQKEYTIGTAIEQFTSEEAALSWLFMRD
ncbi:hypothetical protein GCM10028895_16110 [Pontibacter rugosus]